MNKDLWLREKVLQLQAWCVGEIVSDWLGNWGMYYILARCFGESTSAGEDQEIAAYLGTHFHDASFDRCGLMLLIRKAMVTW